MLIMPCFRSHDVVIGPAKHCVDQKYWRRGGEPCWDIPEKCATVKKESKDAPIVVCENGETYPAKAVV